LRHPLALPTFLLNERISMRFGKAASFDSRTQMDPAEERRTVRRGFWRKVRRVAAQIPFAEDLLTAYYCAFDRATPAQVRTVLIGALAYFVLPFDVVPDFLPALGFTDDAAVLATALKMVVDNIKPEHREAAKSALARVAD
jgi:uncharacterized membrane protein YkvA (DUF1232 family)